MTKSFTRATALLAVVGGSLLLQGCVVGAVVGAGAAVVGPVTMGSGGIMAQPATSKARAALETRRRTDDMGITVGSGGPAFRPRS